MVTKTKRGENRGRMCAMVSIEYLMPPRRPCNYAERKNR